jgi:membrane-bound metal-dependent hydrolase YbcI (DUF457 family)
MNHTFFIIVHTVAATVALLSAIVALRTARVVTVHTISTTVMAVSLAPSLWLSRTTTPAPLQLIFLGLLLLSVMMTYRSVQAWRLRPRRPRQRPGHRYVAAVGFNLIGLVTGFVTVGVVRLGWGAVGVTLAAVAIPVVGHQLLGRAVQAARADSASVPADVTP